MKKKNIKRLLNKLFDLIREDIKTKEIVNDEDFFNLVLQKTNTKIIKPNHEINNKYVNFRIKKLKKCSPTSFTSISVIFEDKKQGLPIGCIIHMKRGYMHALEIYSCDLEAFDSVCLSSIDLKFIEYTFQDMKNI